MKTQIPKQTKQRNNKRNPEKKGQVCLVISGLLAHRPAPLKLESEMGGVGEVGGGGWMVGG